ncbi:MAG: prephenate dehydratase [Planctomycetes bacterium]|nr:prephenate dehydratase [Planctomycetota bacterium]
MAKRPKKSVAGKCAAAAEAAVSAQRLAEMRHRIDELDRQIVEVLNSRANVVVEVGKLKRADGKPIYAPDREHVVLSRVARLNHGPLPSRTLAAIYRELMSGSFALERPQRIGYLGPEGSFSNMAAQRKFGSSVEYRPLADIRAVFEEVARGHCDLGIVPIENSVGGGVIDTMDSFIGAHVYVCGEVILEVHHNLLANCPAGRIKAVASKPEVFAQCRNWLSTSFQQAELVPVASTSRAAEMAASHKGMAAIGSTLAAELYELKVIFANIEDTANNMTRFFVISTAPAKRTGTDKTSLVFTTAHRAGALVAVLNVLAKHGVNLTNIDTRPSKRRNWEYYFFVDAEGHCEDEHFTKALAAARDHCGELHVLGSFPRASEPV